MFRRDADGQDVELPGSTVALEVELQRRVEAGMETMLGIRFLASEYPTGPWHRGRIDTLGLDENGSPVVVEFKKGSDSGVLSQAVSYLSWLESAHYETESNHVARCGVVPHRVVLPDQSRCTRLGRDAPGCTVQRRLSTGCPPEGGIVRDVITACWRAGASATRSVTWSHAFVETDQLMWKSTTSLGMERVGQTRAARARPVDGSQFITYTAERDEAPDHAGRGLTASHGHSGCRTAFFTACSTASRVSSTSSRAT